MIADIQDYVGDGGSISASQITCNRVLSAGQPGCTTIIFKGVV
jgi:hypothetical protein